MSRFIEKEKAVSALLAGGARLDWADLRQADLAALTVSDASLTDPTMTEASIERARFDDVNMGPGTGRHMRASGAQFQRCALTHMSIGKSNFASGRFVNCRFEHVSLIGSNLRGAHFDCCKASVTAFHETDLTDARFLSTVFSELALAELSAVGAIFQSCLFDDVIFAEADFARASFRGSVFRKVEVEDCSFIDADFRGADMRHTEWFVEDYAPSVFTGATYDSTTQFPEGFDPEALGMRRMDDEEFESAPPVPELTTCSAAPDDPVPTEEPVLREGFFVTPGAGKRLSSGPVGRFLGELRWPPAEYDGADTDASLVAELLRRVEGMVESSDTDVPYLGFVAAPGVALPVDETGADRLVDAGIEETKSLTDRVNKVLVSVGDFPAPTLPDDDSLDDEEIEDDVDDDLPPDDPLHVMLGMYTWEIHDAIDEEGPNWWNERWERDEYERRMDIGRFMNDVLTNVEYDYVDLPDDWSAVYFSGTAPSGATVGLLGARLFRGRDD